MRAVPTIYSVNVKVDKGGLGQQAKGTSIQNKEDSMKIRDFWNIVMSDDTYFISGIVGKAYKEVSGTVVDKEKTVRLSRFQGNIRNPSLWKTVLAEVSTLSNQTRVVLIVGNHRVKGNFWSKDSNIFVGGEIDVHDGIGVFVIAPIAVRDGILI